MSGSNAQADAILKKLNDIQEHVGNRIDKSEADLKQRIDAVAEDAKAAEAEMTRWRQENVSITSPVTDEQALYLEQKGGLFGGKFRMPYRKMLALPKNEALNKDEHERLKSIHDLHDACVLRWYALQKRTKPGQGESWMIGELAKTDDFKLYAQQLERTGYVKAVDDILNPAGGAGAFLDFTILSAQLIDMVREGSRILPLFPTIALQRAKQDVPAFRGDTKAVQGGAATPALPISDSDNYQAGPPSNAMKTPTLGEIGFVATHCLGFLAYNDDQLEDSIVPILPMLRGQASLMITRAMEDAIINGDETATHMDNAIAGGVAAPDFRKAWYGLRWFAQEGTDPGTHTTDEAGTSLAANFNSRLQGMGKYAQNLERVYALVNVLDWLKLGADSALQTVQNFGLDRALLREGVAQIVHGVKIVLNEFVPRNLGATGSGDASPARSAHIFFRPDRFWIGQKNELDIESVRVPQSLSNWIQADLRVDFQPLDLDKGTTQFADAQAPVDVGLNTL